MVRTARPRLVRVPRMYRAWQLRASCPVPQVRTLRWRLVRVSTGGNRLLPLLSAARHHPVVVGVVRERLALRRAHRCLLQELVRAGPPVHPNHDRARARVRPATTFLTNSATSSKECRGDNCITCALDATSVTLPLSPNSGAHTGRSAPRVLRGVGPCQHGQGKAAGEDGECGGWRAQEVAQEEAERRAGCSQAEARARRGEQCAYLACDACALPARLRSAFTRAHHTRVPRASEEQVVACHVSILLTPTRAAPVQRPRVLLKVPLAPTPTTSATS